jgi:hypothetical protein
VRKKTGSSGRPPVLADGDVVFIDGSTARTILQADSDRRAMINRLVELGGRATVQELNKSFGFDTRTRLLALMQQGWLAKVGDKVAAVKPARRTKSMFNA